MIINNEIRRFSEFLNHSWDIVVPMLINRSYTSDNDSISDWLQANWELLIERQILGVNNYLEVYGSGADFNGAYSRITDFESTPTFSIKICGKENMTLDNLHNELIKIDNLTFDKLVSFQNKFYTQCPPFEYVLLEDNNGIERVIGIDDINFQLQKI